MITNEQLKEHVRVMLMRISDTLKHHPAFEITTCDAPNWSEADHRTMMELRNQGIKGCIVNCQYRHECWDWTVTRMDSGERYELP